MVVNLKLREDVIVEKCLGRRICGQCGKNFNLACIDVKGENGLPPIYMAPLLPPNNCMSKLITRADDTEEVVRNRLQIYNDMVCAIHTCCIIDNKMYDMFSLMFKLYDILTEYAMLIGHFDSARFTCNLSACHLHYLCRQKCWSAVQDVEAYSL